MGLIYLVMVAGVYGMPLIGSMILTAILARTVFSKFRLRWVISAVLILAASCVPWLVDLVKVERDLAAYAPDTITPDALALEPGALWRLEDGNHAGITCGYNCEYTRLSFVTQADVQDVTHALQLGGSGAPLARHDLWEGLVDSATDRSNAFPYQYAFVSLPVFQDFGVEQSGSYRKDHWPESGKGVHLLARLPPDGQLDFGAADILYRRYNIQTDVAYPFFWGVAKHTIQTPSVPSIFDDLTRISQDG